MLYRSIDDIVAKLDAIIAISRERGSADGYFAALYRRVTVAVATRARVGSFDDAAQMERFVVSFAIRYADAWTARERGEATSGVWRVALGCDRNYWPVVLQHLLLGMNAHINLDLGIVTAEAAAMTQAPIEMLRRDFDAINDVLCDMIDEIQDRLTNIWPAMRVIDRVCGDADEAVANFSIRHARDQAWSMATTLAALPTMEKRQDHIQQVDARMSALGKSVLHPGPGLALKLAWVRLRERGTVAEKLDVLLR